MKKVFKILGITLLSLLILLLIIPFAFQSKIKEIVKHTINENLNAHVEFSDVSLSFIRNFPQAQVTVDDLIITNFEPFKDETFVTAKSIFLTMPIKELFKNATDDPIVINEITINETLITLKTNARGEVNYNITKPNVNEASDKKTKSGFKLDVKDYAINNSAITYIDEGSDMAFYITELNHSGTGIFSENVSELDTKTTAKVSLRIDSTDYLSNNDIKLDALIDLDVTTDKYTFKENKALINQLPIEFNGYVQLVENGQDVAITFENPGASFKDFLAVIPKTYSKDIESVETSGDFKIKGAITGLISDETIPKLDINITSNNASFKYPDLPKRVENITINTSIKNETGFTKDTYIAIENLIFKIDQDQFAASATLKNISENMLVNADIDGTINLNNISKAYPIDMENELRGILKAKFNTSFDMNAIKTNAYGQIKNNGVASISEFVFSSEDIVNPIHITKADMVFNPETVSLNRFEAQTGKSDLNATGTIRNLLGFLLSDNTLQGEFNLNSNLFLVSDFMAETTTKATDETATKKESLKIPAFLDCTIHADAKQVVYDNLNLKNLSGTLYIKDQQATLSNMTSQIFDGTLALSGTVSTQNTVPTFNLNLGVDSFDISKSFNDLELLQNLAPIAKVLQGKLNSIINISGSLDETFSPNLNSITGNAFAELLTTKIEPKENGILSKLEGQMDFIDFKKLDLKDLKTHLTFENGQVTVKPFQIHYEDISIEVSGSHGFDKTVNYNTQFMVPAKYLGSDINRLIGKINDPEVNKIAIPIHATITGSYTNPSISTDLSSSISNLTKQLIEIEKQKLLNQGSTKIKDLLSDMMNSNNPESAPVTTDSTTTQTDSTKTNTNSVEENIKNVIGGILNKNKQKKDSTN